MTTFILGAGEEKKMKGPDLTLTLADLPDIVVGQILGRLPIKEAGRTSVLARSWRHRWRSMLDLDLSGVSDPAVISQVLLLHHGPLRLFKAVPELDDCSPIVPCWLSFLSHHSSTTLRSLSLGSISWSSDNLHAFSLNSIASYFPNLTRLSLEFCGFTLSPSTFKGFPNLRSLNIQDDHSCNPQLSFLISTCPLLEELILENLMTDTIDDTIDDFCIVAPNLRHLKIRDPGPCHFSLSSAPLIETSDIDLDGEGMDAFNLLSVLGAMPAVKNLQLGRWILESWAMYMIETSNGCIPARVPISLDHLRSLSLAIPLERLESLVRCLLRSCPNLEQLETWSECFDGDPTDHIEEEFWEAQEPIRMLDQLRTVTISGIEGLKHELGFIRFLLARAIRLQTMKISFDLDRKTAGILKTKLLEYPMASTQAQILVVGVPSKLFNIGAMTLIEEAHGCSIRFQANLEGSKLPLD